MIEGEDTDDKDDDNVDDDEDEQLRYTNGFSANWWNSFKFVPDLYWMVVVFFSKKIFCVIYLKVLD